jgi:hypothetical protein
LWGELRRRRPRLAAAPASWRCCTRRGNRECRGRALRLWDLTGWHRDYDPCAWRNWATEEQKWVGWEMWVRMEKIVAMALHEAHERQVGEAMDALSKRPEGFYKSR